MQSNFYIPQYQHLTKEAAMDIMEINTIGLRLFTSVSTKRLVTLAASSVRFLMKDNFRYLPN